MKFVIDKRLLSVAILWLTVAVIAAATLALPVTAAPNPCNTSTPDPSQCVKWCNNGGQPGWWPNGETPTGNWSQPVNGLCSTEEGYCPLVGQVKIEGLCVDKATCVGDQTYVAETNTCQNPRCQQDEWLDTANGVCVPKAQCVGQQTYNDTNNTCDNPSCGQDEWFDANNVTCVPKAQCVGQQTYNDTNNTCDNPSCTAPQILDELNGICTDPEPQCKQGQILVDNQCVDPEPQCEQGQIIVDNQCVDPEPQCEQGQIIVDNQCVDPEPQCEQGQIIVDNQCVDPEPQCEQGQIIVDNQCVDPEPQCEQGQTLVDNQCTDPEEEEPDECESNKLSILESCEGEDCDGDCDSGDGDDNTSTSESKDTPPGPPCRNLFDGRVNDDQSMDCAAPVTVYGNATSGFTLYVFDPQANAGIFVLDWSSASTSGADGLVASGVNPLTGAVINVYLLASGEYQVMTTEADGKPYIIVFDANGENLHHL